MKKTTAAFALALTAAAGGVGFFAGHQYDGEPKLVKPDADVAKLYEQFVDETKFLKRDYPEYAGTLKSAWDMVDLACDNMKSKTRQQQKFACAMAIIFASNVDKNYRDRRLSQ